MSNDFDRRQARLLDQLATQRYAIPSLLLMENAGRGVADTLCRLSISGPVAVCCGKGNNGGDGLVLARHLELRGCSPRVLLWAAPDALVGDAAVNFAIVERMGLPLEVFGAEHDSRRLAATLEGAAWIVDGLLGTGARGEPAGPLDEVIDQLNAHGAPRLAIDLPSGLDCDTGRPARHTIRAQHTCTFVAPKRGFAAPGAREYTGEVHVLDIGVPRKLIEEVRAATGESG
jgi:NAD(P)H-hydrate epimerase